MQDLAQQASAQLVLRLWGVGNVCLDGEAVAYGPVQGEVHPGLLNVYTVLPTL